MKTAAWSLALLAGSAFAQYSSEDDCETTTTPVVDPATSAPAYAESTAPPTYGSSTYAPSGSTDPSAAPYTPAAPESSDAPSTETTAPVSPVTTSEPAPSVYTNTKTVYETVCPCDEAGPTHTPGEVYTTFTTETSTTLCNGVPKTFSWGDDWTSTYTSYETSTITTSYTTTVTHPADPTGSGYPTGSDMPYPYPSGSAPAGGYPAPSGSGYPAPSGGYGWPSGYPSGTGTAPIGTGTGAPTASTCSTPSATPECVPCDNYENDKFCGYTIDDNWYDVTPKTCVVKEYTFEITNQTVSPDGYPRMGLIVNNQMPGPMIEASWGDTIKVTVINKLPPDGRNGTTIHFHGIRQNGTTEYDGVSSITQCPIAPGDQMTYTFTASSYGSSWWHAHYALQTYEGIFGPMVIDGPAMREYDADQMFLLSDWSHETADQKYIPSMDPRSGSSGPQLMDNGLINGMGVWQGAGQMFNMKVTSGKTYRLRIVNTAIQSTFRFHVDGHTFEVIAMDFVPIEPYTTDNVLINIGQRYDLIMKADQPVGNYWINSDNQVTCGNMTVPFTKGVLQYDGASSGNPTSQTKSYPPSCFDEPYEKLVPHVAWNAGSQNVGITEHSAIAPDVNANNYFKWTLSGTTFVSRWGDPTLYEIEKSGTVPTYSGDLAIQVPNLGEWVYVVIDSTIPVTHPIHLHGHDFMLLAAGTGPYLPTTQLNLQNPVRRDVATIPVDPTKGLGGYIVIAYVTSNPGVWLLHCHVGWHNAMGFALQIIENLDGIKVSDSCQMAETCKNWRAYANQYNVFVDSLDSGV